MKILPLFAIILPPFLIVVRIRFSRKFRNVVRTSSCERFWTKIPSHRAAQAPPHRLSPLSLLAAFPHLDLLAAVVWNAEGELQLVRAHAGSAAQSRATTRRSSVRARSSSWSRRRGWASFLDAWRGSTPASTSCAAVAAAHKSQRRLPWRRRRCSRMGECDSAPTAGVSASAIADVFATTTYKNGVSPSMAGGDAVSRGWESAPPRPQPMSPRPPRPASLRPWPASARPVPASLAGGGVPCARIPGRQ